MQPVPALQRIAFVLAGVLLAPCARSAENRDAAALHVVAPQPSFLAQAAQGKDRDDEDDDEDADDGDDDDDDLSPYDLPRHLRDRGTGIPISQYATFVERGEWLLLPLFRYADDQDFEYDSGEFGFTPGLDGLRGQYTASEGGVVVAYGFSDRLALEFSAAAVTATLKRAPNDPSNFPAEVKESGLGNVKLRADWRWLTESGRRPEIVTYAQVKIPHNDKDVLTGTPDWLMNAGIGATRGFDFGTLTVRIGAEFDLASVSVGDWGETAVEYLKRVSPRLVVLASLAILEGDEASFIGQVQWQVRDDITLQFGSGVALSSHALDWNPHLGVLIKLD